MQRLLLLCVLLISATSHAGYSTTQYPIVMVPGAAAFDTALGVDYWYGITDRLRLYGAKVYVTNLSSIQSNEQRNEELYQDIIAILAKTGAAKVNLIAHSQGALSARYIAAVMPDKIASVTSVFGMNRGTHFSSGFRAAVAEGSTAEQLLAPLINSTFNFVELLSGEPQDGSYNSETRGEQNILALAQATDPANVAVYNAQYPQALPKVDCMTIQNGTQGDVSSTYYGDPVVNGVRYYSWGGDAVRTNLLDPIDDLFVTFVQAFVPSNFKWDGLVPTCGHALGKVIKLNYGHNHFDAINQTLGLGYLFMDIPTLYVQHANRLKNAGL